VDGLVVHYKQAWPSDAAQQAWLDGGGTQSAPAQDSQQRLNGVGGAGVQGDEQQPPGSPEITAAGAAAPGGHPAGWVSSIGPGSPAAAAAGDASAADASTTAIVLLHGFGGGVFAWRHVLEPLAAAVGVRVVAFDRPGFGECEAWV
jgi:pimeloyl-ACP methyl ester carboxylesterase